MSKFWIACQPSHRPSEHLFVIKSVIAKYLMEKKFLILSSFDLRKMFDFEDIFDCLEKVHSSEVKGKLYRLIFNMNKNVKIKIRTPVGDSNEANTGPIVTQGSVDSGILSSVSIGNNVEEAFWKENKSKNNDREYKNESVLYDSIPLSPLCFMDDCFNMSSTVPRAQQGNDIMEEIINKKGLEFNHDKSNFLVVGNAKGRKKIKAEIGKSPIKLEGNII